MTTQRSARGQLLLPDGPVDIEVVGRGTDGIRVLAARPGLQLRGKFKVRFGPRGLLLGEVSFSRTVGDATEVCLVHRAAWAGGGREALLVFLRDFLHLPDVPAGQLSCRKNGWFCTFGTDAIGPEPQAPKDGASRRRETRHRVQAKLSWAGADDHWQDGLAYDVSSSGLFLTTDAALPTRGDEVWILFPLSHGTEHVDARLQVRVCWVVEGMELTGGGFGVQICGVEDGLDGAGWRTFIEALDSKDSVDMDVDYGGDTAMQGVHA